MLNNEEYRPIDCDIHDKLESLATLKQPTEIVYADNDGYRRRACGVIKDVYTEGKAEWLRMDDGEKIRLDWITTVDGRSSEQSC